MVVPSVFSTLSRIVNPTGAGHRLLAPIIEELTLFLDSADDVRNQAIPACIERFIVEGNDLETGQSSTSSVCMHQVWFEARISKEPNGHITVTLATAQTKETGWVPQTLKLTLPREKIAYFYIKAIRHQKQTVGDTQQNLLKAMPMSPDAFAALVTHLDLMQPDTRPSTLFWNALTYTGDFTQLIKSASDYPWLTFAGARFSHFAVNQELVSRFAASQIILHDHDLAAPDCSLKGAFCSAKFYEKYKNTAADLNGCTVVHGDTAAELVHIENIDKTESKKYGATRVNFLQIVKPALTFSQLTWARQNELILFGQHLAALQNQKSISATQFHAGRRLKIPFNGLEDLTLTFDHRADFSMTKEDFTLASRKGLMTERDLHSVILCATLKSGDFKRSLIRRANVNEGVDRSITDNAENDVPAILNNLDRDEVTGQLLIHQTKKLTFKHIEYLASAQVPVQQLNFSDPATQYHLSDFIERRRKEQNQVWQASIAGLTNSTQPDRHKIASLKVATFDDGCDITSYKYLRKKQSMDYQNVSDKEYLNATNRTSNYFTNMAARGELDVLLIQQKSSGSLTSLQPDFNALFFCANKVRGLGMAEIMLRRTRFAEDMEKEGDHSQKIMDRYTAICTAKDLQTGHTILFAALPPLEKLGLSVAGSQSRLDRDPDDYMKQALKKIKEIAKAKNAVIQILGADMVGTPEHPGQTLQGQPHRFDTLKANRFNIHRTELTTALIPDRSHGPKADSEAERDYIFSKVTATRGRLFGNTITVKEQQTSVLLDFGVDEHNKARVSSNHRPVMTEFTISTK